MSGSFYYTNPDGSVTGARKLWFCEKALKEALEFDDNTKLLIAIEHGLTELFSEEHCREALARYMRGEHRKPGNKPAQRQRNKQRDEEVWKRLHYWKGKGYPILNEAGETDAAGIVADEMSLGRDRVRQIFKDRGGNDPQGPNLIAARLYQAKGGNE